MRSDRRIAHIAQLRADTAVGHAQIEIDAAGLHGLTHPDPLRLRTRSEQAQRAQRQRHAAGQRRGGAQCGIDHRRMQREGIAACGKRRRQRHVDQRLRRFAMQRGDVERGRRRNRCVLGDALRDDDIVCDVSNARGMEFEAQTRAVAAILAIEQGQMHGATDDGGHRAGPGDSAQFEHRGGGRRQRIGKRGANHLQHGGRAQRATIGKEEFVADEGGAVALLVEIGRIGVQQRMEYGTLCLALRDGYVHPVALARERIGRQAGQQRRALRVEAVPVEVQPLGPQFGELRQFAVRDPFAERRVQIGILGEQRQRVAMRLGLTGIGAVDTGGAVEIALQAIDQHRGRIDQQRQAFVHRFAPDLQSVGKRRQRCVATRRQPRQQILRLLPQLFWRTRRQRHDLFDAGIERSLRFGVLLDVVLLNDEVRVRTAGTERRDAGDARQRPTVDDRALPGAQGLHHFERTAGKIDVRIEPGRMQRGHDLAVTQLQQHLGQSGDAGGSFGMTDIGFGRTDQAKAAVLRAFAEHSSERGDLDRIAELGTGAVRFDVADVPRVYAGFGQRLAHGAGLCLRIGYGVAVGLAAVAQCAAADHAIDGITVASRFGQALEHHHTHAFARDITIAAFAETLAMAVAGDELPGAEHQVFVGVDRDVDATGDAQRGAPELEILAGQMDRGQRRGAHRIHDHARPVEIEEIRHAIGDARRIAGEAHALAFEAGLGAEQLVFAVHHARVHADLARQVVVVRDAQRSAGVTGVLDRHPGMLQEQPFLRIDQFGFDRRHIEEARVEFVDAFDEAAPFAEMAAFLTAVLAVVIVPVPARGRHFDDAVLAVAQAPPERIEIARLRIAPAQSDDRDRLGQRTVARRHRGRRGTVGETAVAADAGDAVGLGLRRRDGGGRRRYRSRTAGHRKESGQRCGVRVGEIAGQLADRQIFEEQGLRQRTEGVFQHPGQVQRQDRIDPVVFQRRAWIDPVRRQFQQTGQLRAEIGLGPVAQVAFALHRHRRRHRLYGHSGLR